MSLSVGIIGLPNVGKSTLFNALMHREIAAVGRHPFTTVTPNKGMVAVPDERLDQLVETVRKSEKEPEGVEMKPASIEFVDIAGLVKGAAKGAGLGNQFLGHIREVDLVLHVLREFKNPQVSHVSGEVNPVADAQTVDLELILADFEVAARALEERRKKAKRDKRAAKEAVVLERVKQVLGEGKPVLAAGLSQGEKKLVSSFNFLSLKPTIFILNISEKHLDKTNFSQTELPEGLVLPVCIKLAADLYQLADEEREAFLDQYGLKETGLGQIIKKAYQTLGLITFYTVKGGRQITAWPIKTGTQALAAAEAIHSSFADRFIKAEVVDWQALVKAGSWQKAKEKGLVELRGRDYQIKDGQVIEFKLRG